MKNGRTLVCIDCGGSRVKIVIKNQSQFVLKKCEDYRNTQHMQNIIDKVIDNYFTHDADIDFILTGVKTEGLQIKRNKGTVIELDELECISNIVRYLNRDKGLVVNIGTGTPVLFYDKGEYSHINGTGIGGGTFIGLSGRLLNITNPKEVETMALEGDITKVNLTIGDISNNDLGWLSKDITAANFAKQGGDKRDIALGIHSLIAEVIATIAKGAALNYSLNEVFFSGSVVENAVIRSIIKKYLDIAGVNPIFLDEPKYGTCLGAISLYGYKYQEVEKN